MTTPKKTIGAQSSRSLWMRLQSKAKASTGPTIGSAGRELKRGDDCVDRRELDAALAPERGAGGGAPLVEATRGVLDEEHAPSPPQEAADRRVVADVGRDAEDDDLVRVERVEHRVGVRVREDVEVLLQQQQLAAALDQRRHEARRDRQRRERQRVELLRLGDLLRAA